MNTNPTLNHICITDKRNCYGCTACYAACPVKAISMTEDEEGFKYPVVNGELCLNCGNCTETCPQISGNQHEKTCRFLAATHRQDEIRASSSSGGFFSALAQHVIDLNGVVYGAGYDDNFNVSHIRTDNHEWKKMRTAKYVQSDMGDTFHNVRNDLESGLTVLFTGTPCQVDGLNKFLLNTDTSRLITCDLVCHGVPSPRIWKEYLSLLKAETQSEIGKINFRNKKNCGWHNSTLYIESTDGKILIDETQSEAFFFRLYFNHFILRPSCFSCKYANLNRAGDITIGDYWGIEKHHPELDDDKGVSLVMSNTNKGYDIIRNIEKECVLTHLDECECMQPNLKAPALNYDGRETFWRTYKKYGLTIAGKRMGYIKTNFKDKVQIFVIKVKDKLYSILHNDRKTDTM